MRHHLEEVWSAPHSHQPACPDPWGEDATVADQDLDRCSLESRDAIEHG